MRLRNNNHFTQTTTSLFKLHFIQLSVFRNFFITADIECKEDGGYDVDINDIEEMMMPDLCDWFEDKFKDYTGKYKIEKIVLQDIFITIT